jgi:UDP-N-acetylmuramoyl-tripeptide--D-alanyl-D-alanine ligase
MFWLAQIRRLVLIKTTFIAVTGSCGKTTTTKLAAALLATRGTCWRLGPANFLRHSVKSLLAVPGSSKFCVQEVSAFPPGDIVRHSRVLRPHIAIVTTIGADHYKSFRSLDATAAEKGKLVERLPRHGTAILNADDPHVRGMATKTHAAVLTFGLSPNSDVRAIEVSSAWPDRLKLTVTYRDETRTIRTRLVGEHWTTSVLAAIACGIACGIKLKTCAKVFKRINPVFGRYSVHATRGGPVYVLDTRKAPFWTIASALAFVEPAQAPRKTMVFGTISDYPGSAGAKYRRVARDALKAADRAVFVGPNASHIRKLVDQPELRERLFMFQSSWQASAFLAHQPLPGELIFVKASIVDHLERIMLSQKNGVVCWREGCRRKVECWKCHNFRKPHDPPFGLAEVAASS